MTEWKIGDIGRLNRENIGGEQYGVRGQLFIVVKDSVVGHNIRGELLSPKPDQYHGPCHLSFWSDSEKL